MSFKLQNGVTPAEFKKSLKKTFAIGCCLITFAGLYSAIDPVMKVQSKINLCKETIKGRLNDINSFEARSATYDDFKKTTGREEVQFDYSAANGFGGIGRNDATCVFVAGELFSADWGDGEGFAPISATAIEQAEQQAEREAARLASEQEAQLQEAQASLQAEMAATSALADEWAARAGN